MPSPSKEESYIADDQGQNTIKKGQSMSITKKNDAIVAVLNKT